MQHLRIHPQLTDRARQFRRPMTPMEARLWEHLRNRQCGGWKFRRQVVLGQFIADFYCAEAHLLVEVDGSSHNATVERDRARDAWLQAHHYRTLRVTNTEVRDNLESVLARIQQTCTQRKAELES
jgi:very-short-patch-repair endonuclease